MVDANGVAAVIQRNLLAIYKVQEYNPVYAGIALHNVTLPHSYRNSHAIWDHTVSPATRQR